MARFGRAGSTGSERERGAILPVFCLMLTTLTMSVSFGVDVGRLTAEKRDLQSVVDLVALDTARVLDGKPAANRYPVAESVAHESALRNDFVADELKALDVILGVWTFADRKFVPLDEASAVVPNAVRIVAGSDVDFFFSSFDFRASRQATAVRRLPTSTPQYEGDCVAGDPDCPPPCDPAVDPACPPPPDPDPDPDGFGAVSAFSLGSYLLGFQGSLPPSMAVFVNQKVAFLNATVGAEVGLPAGNWNVTLAGYQGLAAADVTLDQLRVAGGFVSVSELLAADMTFAELAQLQVIALTNEPGGGTSAEAMGALETAATATSTTVFQLGDLVKVEQGTGGAAGSAELNVLELTTGAAMLTAAVDIANGENALSIPISTAIPGVTTSTLRLSVIEPPVIAIGPPGVDSGGSWRTTAQTAQIRAQIDTVFQPVAPDGGYLPGTQFSVPIVLAGAQADAVLASILCLPLDLDTQTEIGVDVAALEAYIGVASSLTSGPLSVDQAAIVTDITGTTHGLSHVSLPGVSEDLLFVGPYDHLNSQDVSGSTSPTGVGVQLDSNLVVNPVIKEAALRAALLPYLAPFDDLVLEPLASALGLQVGGARTTAFHIDCGAPVLVD